MVNVRTHPVVNDTLKVPFEVNKATPIATPKHSNWINIDEPQPDILKWCPVWPDATCAQKSARYLL